MVRSVREVTRQAARAASEGIAAPPWAFQGPSGARMLQRRSKSVQGLTARGVPRPSSPHEPVRKVSDGLEAESRTCIHEVESMEWNAPDREPDPALPRQEPVLLPVVWFERFSSLPE